jgi:hypothetical protein
MTSCLGKTWDPRAPVTTWISSRSRRHLRITSTYNSSLNNVEDWFALITTHAIRRGLLDSVANLKRRIDERMKHYNQRSKPTFSTGTAKLPLAKAEHLCDVIVGI